MHGLLIRVWISKLHFAYVDEPRRPRQLMNSSQRLPFRFDEHQLSILMSVHHNRRHGRRAKKYECPTHPAFQTTLPATTFGQATSLHHTPHHPPPAGTARVLTHLALCENFRAYERGKV